MSSGVIHLGIGGVAGVAATAANYYIYNKTNLLPPINSLYLLLSIPLAMVYSLLPDIDIRSKGSVLFYAIILFITGYFIYQKMYFHSIVILILSILPQFLPHRGITHSFLFAIIFPLPAYFFFYKFNIPNQYFPMFYIATLFGYISHLIADGG